MPLLARDRGERRVADKAAPQDDIGFEFSQPEQALGEGFVASVLLLSLANPRLVHHPVDSVPAPARTRGDLDEVQDARHARLASLLADKVVDGRDEAGLVRSAQGLTARSETALGGLKGKLETPVVDRRGLAHGADIELEAQHSPLQFKSHCRPITNELSCTFCYIGSDEPDCHDSVSLHCTGLLGHSFEHNVACLLKHFRITLQFPASRPILHIGRHIAYERLAETVRN